MKRILVTGGAGFIGANLCERLLNFGHEVICLDNFASSRRENIAHLERRPNFSLVIGDVRVPLSHDVDEIYNLACPASPPKYQADPLFTTETSVLGAINVLDLARRTGARVLHASTSEIYGEPAISPQTESYRGNVNCWGPRACYDEGKRCAEALCFDHLNSFGTDVRVARIFNTYGPRMDPDDGRVISNFIVQALCGQPLTVYGDGSQTRSFCYVDDLTEGFIRLMEHSGLKNPVNLGNPHEVTVLSIARRIAHVGRNCEIKFAPLPRDDPSRRCPDIEMARKELQWQPTVTLQDGLEHTIRYFSALLRLDRNRKAIAEAAE